MEYTLTVVFRRNLSDDSGVADAAGLKGTDQERMVQQLRRELQEAYDSTGMAGSFDILPESYKRLT